MLLNSYGQPTLLQSNQNAAEFEESPLLLCHKDALLGKMLPQNWCGTIYTSASIQREVPIKNYKMPPNGSFTWKNMAENEVTNITIGQNCALRLTVLPLDSGNCNFMFIIQDQYVNSILTDNFTSAAFNLLIRNKLLRRVMSEGIGVLYINDAVYEQLPAVCNYPSKLHLRSLVTLLQPRFVKGIWNNQLPPYILGGCRPVDLYA